MQKLTLSFDREPPAVPSSAGSTSESVLGKSEFAVSVCDSSCICQRTIAPGATAAHCRCRRRIHRRRRRTGHHHRRRQRRGGTVCVLADAAALMWARFNDRTGAGANGCTTSNGADATAIGHLFNSGAAIDRSCRRTCPAEFRQRQRNSGGYQFDTYGLNARLMGGNKFQTRVELNA